MDKTSQPSHNFINCPLVRTVLDRAGIDTSIFKAHSVRGASVSLAKNSGITTNKTLEAADWNTESVFQTLYYKLVQVCNFSEAVLDKSSKAVGGTVTY